MGTHPFAAGEKRRRNPLFTKCVDDAPVIARPAVRLFAEVKGQRNVFFTVGQANPPDGVDASGIELRQFLAGL